uniref:Uncharacterized protein n=1 Tax=Triticum urartu TaxID=4572 RepID=A0A8R7PHN1_TRIUA
MQSPRGDPTTPSRHLSLSTLCPSSFWISGEAPPSAAVCWAISPPAHRSDHPPPSRRTGAAVVHVFATAARGRPATVEHHHYLWRTQPLTFVGDAP